VHKFIAFKKKYVLLSSTDLLLPYRKQFKGNVGVLVPFLPTWLIALYKDFQASWCYRANTATCLNHPWVSSIQLPTSQSVLLKSMCKVILLTLPEVFHMKSFPSQFDTILVCLIHLNYVYFPSWLLPLIYMMPFRDYECFPVGLLRLSIVPKVFSTITTYDVNPRKLNSVAWIRERIILTER
jgi:hypothetical protein